MGILRVHLLKLPNLWSKTWVAFEKMVLLVTCCLTFKSNKVVREAGVWGSILQRFFWRCLLQHCQSWNERLPRVEVSIYAFAEHVHVFDINSGFYFCLQVHLLVWVVSEEQAGFCSNLFFMICWWQSVDIWSCCFMEFIQNFFPVL